ncbi:AcrR family transcriptional regulator [Crossiella equi]|uniref:AcrR family transcriptional regulator n=1 Tax=Crossiella equi TaxID=130796 RepID=A0ABS5ARR5_9PSEU|nr:TetR/AcrR family transcriptional regulator [Crossiella equi]MBP2479250.1 AcrR family transcriptional regulator [Crossiella equi]
MSALTSAQVHLVLAAERLFAERGLEGVSLRQIGTAAGMANNSAVQYHFQTKDRLIAAIFGHRLPVLHQHLAELLADTRPEDLRGWVGCQVTALLTQAERPHSHYLGFLAMLLQHGRWEVFLGVPEDMRETTFRIQQALDDLLVPLPGPLRSQRIRGAMRLVVRTAADRERARVLGRPVLPLAVETGDLVDSVTGFLAAPASPETLAALAAGR